MNLDTLLQLEDEHGLWHPEVYDLKLWAGVRTTVLSTVIDRYLGHNPDSRTKVPLWKRLKLGLLQKHARTLAFAVFGSGTPQYSTAVFKSARPDGFYSYFFERLDKPLIVELSWQGMTSEDQWKNGTAILLRDTLTQAAQVRARTYSLSSADRQNIRSFAALLCRVFELPMGWEDRLVARMNRHVGFARAMRPLLSRYILPRLIHPFVFVHQAAYLESNGVLVKLFHDMGVTVAEMQHGIIHHWHWAYHYSESVLCDTMHPGRLYLPDILLTFGEYWSNHVRMPSQKFVIGFPQLSEAAARAVTHSARQILIISQGTLTERMVALTSELARSLPDYRIIFKLHPLEVEFSERYQALNTFSNVEIKGRVNVHDLIAESSIIVGEGSTVMYEAVAFPNKRIFLLKNDIITMPIGTTFETAEELIALIGDEEKGRPELNPDQFWASDWEARLSAFLHEYLPETHTP